MTRAQVMLVVGNNHKWDWSIVVVTKEEGDKYICQEMNVVLMWTECPN
jgi:hypothetical protein